MLALCLSSELQWFGPRLFGISNIIPRGKKSAAVPLKDLTALVRWARGTNSCSHIASAIAAFMDRVRNGSPESKVADLGLGG